MRLVFALALAGAIVHTGFSSQTETQLDKSIGSLGTLQFASLDVHNGKIADRFPVPPEPARIDLASLSRAVDRYPVGGDPMDDSMIKTNRSVLAVPVPDVPMVEICQALASAAQEHDLPVPFLARLIWQESRFRQSAVSPVGAQGVAQFMPQTADAYGLENPFDPVPALSASARFLRELRDVFGNLGLAAAAYNGGSGRVQNWLARRSGLPEETRNYVRIITGHEPEKWTVASDTVEMAANLPQRAPCEGTAGLARDTTPLPVAGTTTAWVSDTIRKAEEAEAAARIAAAKAAAKAKLLARAKGSKKSQAAKALASNAKGAKGKGVRPNLVIAVVDDRKRGNISAKSNHGKAPRVSEASAAKAKPRQSSAGKSARGKSMPGKPIRLVDARGGR